jgi:hypothetical protein
MCARLSVTGTVVAGAVGGVGGARAAGSRRVGPAVPFRKRVARLATGLATGPLVVARAESETSETSETSGEEAPASTVAGASVEEPVWVKREKQRELEAQSKDLPFGLYLLFSCFVTIAAVGSIFEWSAQNPIFGVIEPDSPLYTPILGVFAVTGIPTAGVLFFKGVSAANAEAERMDAQDGYTPRPNVLNPKKDE